jgi:hypothetical protein
MEQHLVRGASRAHIHAQLPAVPSRDAHIVVQKRNVERRRAQVRRGSKIFGELRHRQRWDTPQLRPRRLHVHLRRLKGYDNFSAIRNLRRPRDTKSYTTQYMQVICNISGVM